MAWEENSCISLHMQLIAILSRIEVRSAPSDQTKRSINFHKSHQNSCVLMPNDKPKTSQKPAEPLR